MLTAIRPVRAADWPAVVSLESAAYRDLGLSEDPGLLRGRAGAGTSFVVEARGRVAGYLLAFPFPYGRSPDLAAGGTVVSGTGGLHLHDLVIAAEHRGGGLGSLLLAHLLDMAHDGPYRRISLVSIARSRTFWAGHGFRPRPEVVVPDGYGHGAVYMSRPL
ncbi:GNAT family N-acetyltransferase [Actinoplanes sp. NBRC 103695]|uniref:GNAT family N-acetyltransferase n=1 Tax=Actinoplanes sp. NBRC 103695 TaxID=3032202 RepID=UPI0024A3AE6E|nr:GNAT family N-acetyltransferase [Actinoplanes sp. NBRC 103695]GLZ01184.1 hypothetical protein Acsp02_84350 [Actinoplanes sp. NBRC 103695]